MRDAAWILWRMMLVFVALFAVVLGPVATFALIVAATLGGTAAWWWPIVTGVLVLAAWGFILVVRTEEEIEG